MHTETVNRVYLYIKKKHAIFKENETKKPSRHVLDHKDKFKLYEKV